MVTVTKPNTAPTFTLRDGIVMTAFDKPSTASNVALQQDGKILLGGVSDGKLALVRYNTDGSLDTSFSVDGKQTTAVPPLFPNDPVTIIPQLDGKILATSLRSNFSDIAVTRYLSNGDPDATFGTNGTLTVHSRTNQDFANVAILKDGKIIVLSNISTTNSNFETKFDVEIDRYNANGSIDTTFGKNGRAVVDLSVREEMHALIVRSDGKLLLGGTAEYPNMGLTDTLVRLNANGSLDMTFDSDGALPVATWGRTNTGSQIALQTDGQIVFGANTHSYTPSSDGTTLRRYTSDGKPDLTFNETGSITLDLASRFRATDFVMSSDFAGNILVAGGGTSTDHVLVSRLKADGRLDRMFGYNGVADVTLPRETAGTLALPTKILVQPDGKILVSIADGRDFTLIRLNPDGSPDHTFSPPENSLNGKSVFVEGILGIEDTPVVLDSNVQILDTELNAARSYAGASLTLRRHEGANADDIFEVRNGTINTLVAGHDFAVDGVTIGRVTTNGAGTLTLTFTANATELLVNKAMQEIAYSNKSDTPPSQVQIDWIFSDGNTGAQGSGGALTATGSSIVTIISTNDSPQSVHALQAQKLAVGVEFTYVVPADSFVDPDNSYLSYSISMQDYGVLPSWLMFNAETRTLSGTPDGRTIGTLELLVTAKDSSGQSAWNVLYLNIAPSTSHIDGTSGADKLTGTVGDDLIQGFAGNDTLDGKAGADTMTGGDGDDTYYIDDAGDTVGETASGGTDTVYTMIASYQLAPYVESGHILSESASDLIGNELANVLYAGKGDNILDGRLGNDTASYAYATASVTVSLSTMQAQNTEGSGIDTLRNIENLSGSRFDDNLTGNQENNTLNGGGGADLMVGGNGSDIYVVDNAADIVRETNADAKVGGIDTVNASVSYTLSTNVENLTLTGTASINATGNSLGNKLVGNSGDNILDGGTGADTMSGGLGNDTYRVDSSSDVVVESAGGGVDTVNSTVTRTLGDYQENLTLTGTVAINATGNSLANNLVGNSGNNILDGGAGADTMSGGLGNDTYYVDNAGDVVSEAPGAGTDTVVATVTRTLGDNQENLTLAGTGAINGTGNSLDNIITGNAARNVLNGGTGADKMSGGLGDDFYYVDNTSDTVVESGDAAHGGTDTVISTVTYTLGSYVENLTLSGTAAINGTGNALANKIIGNNAANTLNGGAGADTMSGGLGSDVFVFNAASETGATSATRDVITDFVRGQDKVDLRGIDANTATVANDAFTTFIAATAAFTAAGQLKFVDGVLYGNTDGDADAEFAIQLTGITQLTTADIML